MSSFEVVIAWATVGTTVTAIGALVVSIISLLRSGSARQDASLAQWKMNEHLETIAQAQAEATQAMAAGRQPSATRPGVLSARLWRRGRGEALTVANVGTEPVTVVDLETDHGGIFVRGELEALRGVELHPGEEHHLVVGLSMADPSVIPIRLRWNDSRGGEHQREQRLTLQ